MPIPVRCEKNFSTLKLLLVSRLLLLVALSITVISAGPVISREGRVGKNQDPFGMFSFRTVHMGGERKHGELVTSQLASGRPFFIDQPEDPQTTSMGKVLRKLSINELPRSFDVIHGAMLLVGPRPIMSNEVRYPCSDELRKFSVVHIVTWLAQINGRSFLSPEGYVGLNFVLVDNYSTALYSHILLLTRLTVFSTRGTL